MKNTNNTLAATQLSQVINAITDMDNDDTIAIYNEYASNNGYELIFDNDEQTLNDTFLTPYDAIRQTNNKDYNDNDDYFTFNGYGHAVSFDYRLSDNSPIDIEELAQWLISEDKLSEYDIAVTTLDDMLASIEDNISDDSVMLNKLGNFLMVDLDNDSYEDNVYDVMIELNNYTYEQIQEIITMLGINYQ